MEQQLEARGSGHHTMGDRSMYLAWCAEARLDPEDTATVTAYEDWWLDTHGVPEHQCNREGHCDVCRA